MGTSGADSVNAEPHSLLVSPALRMLARAPRQHDLMEKVAQWSIGGSRISSRGLSRSQPVEPDREAGARRIMVAALPRRLV